jgi:hypothetical protein
LAPWIGGSPASRLAANRVVHTGGCAMPAQSPMWEIAIAILIPLLVMSAALLMERVERHTIGTANERNPDGA